MINLKSIQFLLLFVAVVFAANHLKCGLNGPKPTILESMTLNATEENYSEEDDDLVDLGIVGGKEAKPHDYPWHGKLFIRESAESQRGTMCSCSILNSHWVMTAAHCLYDNSANKVSHDWIQFKGGIHTITGNTEPSRSIRKIVSMHIHDHYDHHSITTENDLALLRLDKPLDLEDHSKHLAAICLPGKGKDYSDKSCIITGWGQVSKTEEHSNTLQQLKLKVLKTDKCVKKWSSFVGEKMLCAGEDKNRGTCHGDSGGPLVCYSKKEKKWFQAGIAMFADKHCADERIDHPSVFTRVEHYVDWIWHTIDQN